MKCGEEWNWPSYLAMLLYTKELGKHVCKSAVELIQLADSRNVFHDVAVNVRDGKASLDDGDEGLSILSLRMVPPFEHGTQLYF